MNREMSLIKTFAVIVAVYIVFWTPIVIVYIFFPTSGSPLAFKVRIIVSK